MTEATQVFVAADQDAAQPVMATLDQVQAWLPGARLVGNTSQAFARVHTDSRSVRPGDLFVALRGDRFDAHDFLAQARVDGAAGAIAEHGLASAGLAGFEVADSRLALGQLAAGWRSQFAVPAIAVTGSNGKTTVTQMIASILQAHCGADRSLATQGNFNNDIGVPLTLLRWRPAHAMAVLELGMNHPGEIAQLAQLLRPTVALVNNAQREHQEFMGTVAAVAQENGAVLAALDAGGVAVFPADDDYAPVWRAIAGARRCITFAVQGAADVRLRNAAWNDQGVWSVAADTPAGPLAFELGIAGAHNVKNALAATAAALAAAVPLAAIARGLAAFAPVQGRSRAWARSLAGRSVTLVDDTYNANPDSVRAAIDVLAALPAPRLLVLGDMGEVGDQGPQFHAEAGAYAQAQGIDEVLLLGALSVHTATAYCEAVAPDAADRCLHLADIDLLNTAVCTRLPRIASVLVKGSRFMQMERVVDAVLAATEVRATALPEPTTDETARCA